MVLKDNTKLQFEKIKNIYVQNVKVELHFAFFYKVQLKVDSILNKTTYKYNSLCVEIQQYST